MDHHRATHQLVFPIGDAAHDLDNDRCLLLGTYQGRTTEGHHQQGRKECVRSVDGVPVLTAYTPIGTAGFAQFRSMQKGGIAPPFYMLLLIGSVHDQAKRVHVRITRHANRIHTGSRACAQRDRDRLAFHDGDALLVHDPTTLVQHIKVHVRSAVRR